jgi:TRAP-type transport system periplasmic protein
LFEEERNLNATTRLSGTLGLLAIMAVALAACGGAAESESTEVRLAVGDPIHSAVGVTAERYAEIVEEESGGEVIIEVHPDGTLFGGDQEAAIDQLRDGTLDIAILSTSVYANFDSRMNAISLPYLFTDLDQFQSYLEDEPGEELLAGLDELNTTGLALMTRTFRHVTNSVRPIEEPEDLEGLQIRTPNNQLWVAFFQEMGANPSPMDFTEVYSALQLDTIDGQENPIEVPLSNNFYEVQEYLSLTGHIADGYVLGVNSDLWESLSPEQQEAMANAAEEAATFKAEYDAEEEIEMIEELESEHGMQINDLTEEQREEFSSIARDLYPQFEEIIGDEEFMQTTLDYVEQD